jgi:hypothetical protein
MNKVKYIICVLSVVSLFIETKSQVDSIHHKFLGIIISKDIFMNTLTRELPEKYLTLGIEKYLGKKQSLQIYIVFVRHPDQNGYFLQEHIFYFDYKRYFSKKLKNQGCFISPFFNFNRNIIVPKDKEYYLGYGLSIGYGRIVLERLSLSANFGLGRNNLIYDQDEYFRHIKRELRFRLEINVGFKF